VKTAGSEYGKLDVLINNAGILRLGFIESQPLEEYLAVVNVNQVGCFLGMQAAIPALKANGGGSIVNTSSTSGFIGVAGFGAHTPAKFAGRGVTKGAGVELGHHNIRVNSVHPGGIDTAMVAQDEFEGVDSDAIYGAQPIPRVGRPEEVAKLMVFLASDDSSYSTGSEFVCDGGIMAGPPIAGLDDD